MSTLSQSSGGAKGSAEAELSADGSTGGFEVLIETKPHGLVRRFVATKRHFLGLPKHLP